MSGKNLKTKSKRVSRGNRNKFSSVTTWHKFTQEKKDKRRILACSFLRRQILPQQQTKKSKVFLPFHWKCLWKVFLSFEFLKRSTKQSQHKKLHATHPRWAAALYGGSFVLCSWKHTKEWRRLLDKAHVTSHEYESLKFNLPWEDSNLSPQRLRLENWVIVSKLEMDHAIFPLMRRRIRREISVWRRRN